MFKSYFKMGWRNLLRGKVYSAINIVGLSTGMTVAMLIGMWIWDEVSFNSYYSNHEQLATIKTNITDKGITGTYEGVQIPLADALQTKFGEDFTGMSLVLSNTHLIVAIDKKLSCEALYVQKDFPDMFSLQMLQGRRDALKDPSTLLLSRSTAIALFGDTDPIGKSVKIDGKADMMVGGVYDDFPDNTTFSYSQFLMPWENRENVWNTSTDWYAHCCSMWVQLADNATIEQVNQRIKNIPTPYVKPWTEEIMLYPLDKVHLYNEFEEGKSKGGHIRFVRLFGMIGAFVLFLACINFMNLSTARSEKRAKEVGVRKTIGSVQWQLVFQFLTESILVTLLAFLLSLVLVQLFLPSFNFIADKKISVPWTKPTFWLTSLGFALFTGIISGGYPAFYLSSFKPIKVLKGTFKAGRFATLPRKVLVVIQFTISITLTIGTIVIFQQIQYAKNRPPGFSRDGLISVAINTPELQNHYDAVRNGLLQTGAVQSLARSSQSPANFNSDNALDWTGKDPGLVAWFRNVTVTPEFGKTVGWTIKAGCDFSTDFPIDSSSMILNEAAVKLIGFKNPIGEVVTLFGNKYTIIGVVKDMITQSPYNPPEPSLFVTRDDPLRLIILRLNPAFPVRESLAKIEPIFKKYNPDGAFEFSFVDADYGWNFYTEEQAGKLAGLFAMLAIFISCIGLFGLSSFVAEQRTKEIGIRKVLGASVRNLWEMLSKDFVLLVLIACAISIPLAILIMGDWLEHFQYRTTMSWQLFAEACIGALIITLLTVSYQSIRAAHTNPVNSLRSE
jgi:ABC-type antimicrobial peptide transport system permease subunit